MLNVHTSPLHSLKLKHAPYLKTSPWNSLTIWNSLCLNHVPFNMAACIYGIMWKVWPWQLQSQFLYCSRMCKISCFFLHVLSDKSTWKALYRGQQVVPRNPKLPLCISVVVCDLVSVITLLCHRIHVGFLWTPTVWIAGVWEVGCVACKLSMCVQCYWIVSY